MVRGSQVSFRIRTAPQRERFDTHETRRYPAEGSPATLIIRTAPQRERFDRHETRRNPADNRHSATARALRHAQNPQKVSDVCAVVWR